MAKTITIPIEKYKRLREHLEMANELFKSLGMVGDSASERRIPNPLPKETKAQKINKYKKLIENGTRVGKPNYLKK